MSERTSVAKNAGMALAGEMSNHVMLLVWSIIVSRYLLPHDYGVYGYAMSVVALFFVLTDLGISTMLVREIARDISLAEKMMPQIMAIRMAIGVLLAAGVAIFGMRTGGDTGMALVLMSLYLALEPASCYIVIFKATENMKYHALVQVISRGLMLLALPVVMVLHAGLMGIISVYLLGTVTGIVVVRTLVVKHYNLRMGIGFKADEWVKVFKAAIPFAAMSILWEVYARISQILIPHMEPFMDGFAANGLYRVAAGVALIPVLLARAMNSAFYPYFSRKSVHSEEAVKKETVTLYRYSGIVSLAVAAFVGIPAADWLRLIWSDEYMGAALALSVLMLGMPFVYLREIHLTVLYSYHKEKLVFLFTLVSVLLFVALNFILIPVMGFVGAAVANLATHMSFYLLTFYATNKELGGISVFRALTGPVLSAGAAAGTLYVTRGLMLPLTLLAGLAVFSAALFVTGSVVRKDIEFVKSLVSRS